MIVLISLNQRKKRKKGSNIFNYKVTLVLYKILKTAYDSLYYYFAPIWVLFISFKNQYQN